MRQILVLTVVLSLAGCEGGPAASLTSMRPATKERTAGQLENKYRQQYLTERDPDALQWLLVTGFGRG